MNQNRILALSSSRVSNSGYLEKALPLIDHFLEGKALKIAFIPFASADNDFEEYASRVREALKDLPVSIVTVSNDTAKSTIENSDAIMVGGGNTFKLLHDLYQLDLLDFIRKKVNGGAPFIGWSAGSNITGKTIGTTNDMPIIQPRSFDSLGLLPFQINPHYFNKKIEGFHGETRDQRLEEFIKMNHGTSIVCLPEGTALESKMGVLKYIGDEPGVLFEGKEKTFSRKEIEGGADLSFLM